MDAVNKKILIIDDDNRNIFALTLVLKSRGYQCISSVNAIKGLKILSESPDIGLVLMDMMMPEMDGYQAIKEIRQNSATPDIPIIAVTAQAMAGDREKCLEAGADSYISKPIDVDELLKLLNRYLKKAA